MRLYVPTNGDQIRLVSEWKFTLYSEMYGDRNKTLFERLGVKKVERKHDWGTGTYRGFPAKLGVSLPPGTVLQIDRVYIRKFNRTASSVDNDFDSLTFQVIKHPTWSDPKRKVLARFWAKLSDVNNIEFEHETPPRWSEEKEET